MRRRGLQRRSTCRCSITDQEISVYFISKFARKIQKAGLMDDRQSRFEQLMLPSRDIEAGTMHGEKIVARNKGANRGV